MHLSHEGKAYKPPRVVSHMKAVLIGRHQLLPAQIQTLTSAQIEITKQVPQVPTEPQQLQQFIQQLKQEGVEAIVIQALPPHLIAQLQQHFTIFMLKMEAVKTTESEEEAEALKAQAPEKRVILQSALGEKKTFRVVEFKGLFKVKLIIQEEPVVIV